MNETGSQISTISSDLVDLLRRRAIEQPDAFTYRFLEDGENLEVKLTNSEIDLRARKIAAYLQEYLLPGDRAVLLYPPGLEYIAAFFGCLYAGIVAVPAYPPDIMRLDRTLPRFLSTVRDCQPAAILTVGRIKDIGKGFLVDYPEISVLRWVATDELSDNLAQNWVMPDISSETLAFLQYTSGSTAGPKGVMLSHGNLLHNLFQITSSFAVDAESRGLIWLPPYHDMGLIGGILAPLYAGIVVTLMSPLDFLQRPIRWLRAISRSRATISGGPNFAYELCVNKIKPEQCNEVDLSSWDVAFNGAEPVRHQTLERFTEKFSPFGFKRDAFLPCYGLAEISVFATGGKRGKPPVVGNFDEAALANGIVSPAVEDRPGVWLVSSGNTLLDQKVRIVDPVTSKGCLPGIVGEVWLSSTSVAQGYWGQPTLSDETFRAQITDEYEDTYLRTGDLGFTLEGELYITGRIKDLIIIDGLNHYPQDIELSVENSHPAIRKGCCAAFSIQENNQEKLVILAEAKATMPEPGDSSIVHEIHQAIRSAVVRNHDLRVHQVVLLKVRTIPKTSSGKIQRHACKAEFLSNHLELWDTSAIH